MSKLKQETRPSSKACIGCGYELLKLGAVMSDQTFLATSLYCPNSDCPRYGLFTILADPPTFKGEKEVE